LRVAARMGTGCKWSGASAQLTNAWFWITARHIFGHRPHQRPRVRARHRLSQQPAAPGANLRFPPGTNARAAGEAADAAGSGAPERFSRLLGRLYPTMLRLAAGADPVGRQLFAPLLESLVHWVTRWEVHSRGGRAVTVLQPLQPQQDRPPHAWLRPRIAPFGSCPALRRPPYVPGPPRFARPRPRARRRLTVLRSGKAQRPWPCYTPSSVRSAVPTTRRPPRRSKAAAEAEEGGQQGRTQARPRSRAAR
jgi:hypothetical protein